MMPMSEREFLKRAGYFNRTTEADVAAESIRDFLRSNGYEDAARYVGDYIERIEDRAERLAEEWWLGQQTDRLSEARASLKELVNALREGRTDDAQKLAEAVEL